MAVIQHTDKMREVIEKCVSVCHAAETVETVEQQDDDQSESKVEEVLDEEAFEERCEEFKAMLDAKFLTLDSIRKLKAFWNQHTKGSCSCQHVPLCNVLIG